MTIVEMAVGVGLTVLLGGALASMALLAFRVSNTAKMKAEAARYAEEAIEVARHTRDSTSPSSLEILFSECVGKANCCVSADGLLYSAGCSDPEALGVFKRKITVTDDSVNEPNDRVLIKVEVYWAEGGLGKSVSLETYLTAWSE